MEIASLKYTPVGTNLVDWIFEVSSSLLIPKFSAGEVDVTTAISSSVCSGLFFRRVRKLGLLTRSLDPVHGGAFF